MSQKAGRAITRYVRDASGNVMAVYQADTLSERPIYGSSRLGNLSYASKPGYRTVGHKQYELSNHLGNVLAVVSDRIRMKTDSTWTQVLSRTDYYPFGLEMTGRTESAGYRYGFNGKEKDPSGQWSNQSHYDYGFRIYNPTIGKFLSVDPLTGKYPMLTPYQFASNTPIQAIDLDGLEGLIVIRTGDKPPTNFNKILFASDLQKKLIENGAHKDTRVVYEFSKEYKEIGVWDRFWNYQSDQSATITFRDFNVVLDRKHEDAGGYGEDGQVIIYRGLVGLEDFQMKDREIPTWKYVNAALHELGHAVYDFYDNDIKNGYNGLGHDNNGFSKTGKDLMDYHTVYKQGAEFSDEQKKVIKEKAGKNEDK